MRSDDIVAAHEPSLASPAGEGPLREVAHAFRLNAEALHTLKQMQGDLARQVRQGDRSQLVLQSTRALNDTFRQLSSVQQELLRRIRQGNERGSRSPVVPLMLLGLLVVLLGGVYVILRAVDRRDGGAATALGPAAMLQRERDAWKEGRKDGATHADQELARLQKALDDAHGRVDTLQGQLDTRREKLAEMDRARRRAEVERDEFASQVRKAQSQVAAQHALEEEIVRLKLQMDGARRAAAQAEQDLDLERRKTNWLRQRMADSDMGIGGDDPPWRPGQPAGSQAPPPGAEPPARPHHESYKELAEKARRMLAKQRGEKVPEAGSTAGPETGPTPAPAKPTPAKPALAKPAASPASPKPPRRPASGPQGVPSAAAPGRSGAAFGGEPDAPPPPEIRRRVAAATADAARADAARRQVNALLQAGRAHGGEDWRLERAGGIDARGLQDVVLVRYGALGRPVERVQARRLGVVHDRARGEVALWLRDGTRFAAGQRLRLPAAGSGVVVAQDAQAAAWTRAGLGFVQER
jgi:hypothetical protein